MTLLVDEEFGWAQFLELVDYGYPPGEVTYIPYEGTNLKMIFLLPGWDVLLAWGVPYGTMVAYSMPSQGRSPRDIWYPM